MNSYQNDWNLGKRQSRPRRLITPGSIIFLIILLGVAVLFLLQHRANNLKETTGSQPGTIQQSSGQSPTPANELSAADNKVAPLKVDQLPVFDIAKRSSQPSIDNETAYLQWMSANTPEKKNYLTPKWQRERAIIANKDATDPRVIEAFLRAPREFFFPKATTPVSAYASAAISIGYGQTISGPHLVTHMTQAIDPQSGQKVLEIGTGSGYQSAVLAELANYVYTIEIVPQLAQRADAVYSQWTKNYPEYANIKRKNADGYYGWAEYAPFDRIIVTAGIDHVPPDLLKQLAPGGIMVIPVGPPSGQTVLKITKQVLADGSVTFVREDIYHGRRKVIFVPFTATQGIHSNAADKTPGQ
jgi:protein-L-isoaspartate(D-aspartate) O-methyltransferase